MSTNYISIPAAPPADDRKQPPAAGTAWVSFNKPSLQLPANPAAVSPQRGHSPPPPGKAQGGDVLGGQVSSSLSRSAPNLNISSIAAPRGPSVARPIPPGKVTFDKDQGAIVHHSLEGSKVSLENKLTDRWVSALASLGLTQGKAYFEVRILTLPSPAASVRVGVATRDKFDHSNQIGNFEGSAAVDVKESKAFIEGRQTFVAHSSCDTLF